jgi:hypothetical protein
VSLKDVSGLLSLVGHDTHQTEYEKWLFEAVARVVMKAFENSDAAGSPPSPVPSVVTCSCLESQDLSEQRQKILRDILNEGSIKKLLCIARCNRFGLFGFGEECAGTVMSEHNRIAILLPVVIHSPFFFFFFNKNTQRFSSIILQSQLPPNSSGFI